MAARTPAAVTSDIPNWQLTRARPDPTLELKSAESETLERQADPSVKLALQALSEDLRTVVYLADVEGFAYRKIAGVMGTRIGTVSSRLYRAHRQLRRLRRDHAAARGISPRTAQPRNSPCEDFPVRRNSRCLSRHRQMPLAVARLPFVLGLLT